MPHEEWTIPSDGVALHALRIRTIQSQAKGVAIYFHGNGGSIADWLAAAPPFLDMGYDVGLLLKYPFATEAIAKDVTCPTFLIHGDHDDLVPFNHGQQLAQMFGGPTRLYAIPGGGHNSFWGQQAYLDALADIAEIV
jgi:pimeloyl-ACP methyl ester carboxylesterase